MKFCLFATYNSIWSQRGSAKRYALGFLLLAVLMVAWVVFIVTTPPQQEKVSLPEVVLHETGVDSLPDFPQDFLADPHLKASVEKSLEYLKNLPSQKRLPFGRKEISAKRLRETIESFLSLINEGLSPEEFRKRLDERFSIYRIAATMQDQCGGEAAPLLVTGYFQPEIKASFTRKAGYEYPLYGIPESLVEVALRDFDSTLPSKTLYGRVEGNKLLPYYSRYEIDAEGKLADAPVLAWIPDEIDGLMLHIQGSGLLRFPDGERRFIHYAASNGRPYGSIGKVLIDKGWLKAADADWPGIKKWAKKHPDHFRLALKSNPRYIFFRWERQGPVGSMGAILEPMRSVAMDPTLFPLAALCLIDIRAEEPLGFMGFVLNQDRGSAIKGPCRVDLYCGAGDRAGEIAGKLRHRANLYLFLKKE